MFHVALCVYLLRYNSDQLKLYKTKDRTKSSHRFVVSVVMYDISECPVDPISPRYDPYLSSDLPSQATLIGHPWITWLFEGLKGVNRGTSFHVTENVKLEPMCNEG